MVKKNTVEQAIKGQEEVTLVLDGSGWSTPRPVRFNPGKECQFSFYRRLGGPLGPLWTGAKNLASTGIRSPDRPARIKSLCRLSYPGPLKWDEK